MRINDDVKQEIVKYAKMNFTDFHLYLFGSRVDDSKKGGDIDLFVESKNALDLEKQMSFLKQIYKNVTQKKVDLVVKTPFVADKPIFEDAKKTGILLC